MPKISFTFTGFVNNAPIEKALSIETMREVDVSHMTSKELLEKINEGELAIGFADAYTEGDGNVEMGDFTISDND
jgi:hypothetical protein